MNAGTGWLTKPFMFLSSYAPLLLLLTLRFDDACLRTASALLALVGVVGLLLLLRLHHEPASLQARTHITAIRPAGEGASAYLAGYLLPFLTVSNPSTRDLIIYVGFFLVAFAVTTKTGVIQVNPTLFLLGYNIFAVADDTGAQRYLLARTRENITPGTTVMTSRMTNDVLLYEGLDPQPVGRGGDIS